MTELTRKERKERIRRLESEILSLRREPEPERVCSRCGVRESLTEFGHLIDIRVIIADREEGFADITQLICDTDIRILQIKLMELGFKDHRHGSIDFLEDIECPGFEDMDKCKTPTAFGRVVIGNPYYNENI
jgi:hypothetical protein